MQRQFLTFTTWMWFLINVVYAKVFHPESSNEALAMIDDNNGNVTILLFYDQLTRDKKLSEMSAQDQPEQTPGFWGNLMTGIRGMFNSNDKTVGELAGDFESQGIFLEIDATNPDFDKLQRIYGVPSIPFIVILLGDRVLYKGIPNDKTFEIYNQITAQTNGETKTVNVQNSDEVLTEVITIEPGKTEFMQTSKDDPFYFGDNNPVYDTKFYVDPMNGGLIEKSNRINNNGRTVITTYQPKIETVVIPEKSAREVKTIRYVQEPVVIAEPPPKRIDIQQEPTHSMTNVAFSKPVNLTETLINTTLSEECEIIRQNETEKYENNTLIDVRETVQRWKTSKQMPKEKVVRVIEEVVQHNVVDDARYIVTRDIIRKPEVITRTYTHVPGKIDDLWQKVLKDEQKMNDQMNKVQQEDQHLARTMQESEAELHESEELFYKAKNAIEKSLADSERELRIYEEKLDELYKARQEAIKARDNLYHPCSKWAVTNEGFIQQQIKAPYKVLRKSNPSSEQANFHEFYDSTKKKSDDDKKEK